MATGAEPVGAGLFVPGGAVRLVVVAKVVFESPPAFPLRQNIEASTTAPTNTKAIIMKGKYRFI